MEKAIQTLQSLTTINDHLRKTLYDNEKLLKNYKECIQLCKHNMSYKLCIFEETSTKYANATIKIYVPECSNFIDYANTIRFTDYIENGTLKKLPYNCVGIIPNYKYVIGDNNLFETNNSDKRKDDYYSIELSIPFVMDMN